MHPYNTSLGRCRSCVDDPTPPPPSLYCAPRLVPNPNAVQKSTSCLPSSCPPWLFVLLLLRLLPLILLATPRLAPLRTVEALVTRAVPRERVECRLNGERGSVATPRGASVSVLAARVLYARERGTRGVGGTVRGEGVGGRRVPTNQPSLPSLSTGARVSKERGENATRECVPAARS